MNITFRFFLLCCSLSVAFTCAASAALPDCPEDAGGIEEPLYTSPTNAGSPCTPPNTSMGSPSRGCKPNDACKNSVCVQRRDVDSICDEDSQCGVQVKGPFALASICVMATDGVKRCLLRAELSDACGKDFPDRVCGKTVESGSMSTFFSPRPAQRVFPGVLIGPLPPLIEDVEGEAAMACVEGRCAATAVGRLGHVCEEGECAEGLSCKMELGLGASFEAPKAITKRCVRVAPSHLLGQCGPAFLVCEEGQECRGGKHGSSCQAEDDIGGNSVGEERSSVLANA